MTSQIVAVDVPPASPARIHYRLSDRRQWRVSAQPAGPAEQLANTESKQCCTARPTEMRRAVSGAVTRNEVLRCLTWLQG